MGTPSPNPRDLSLTAGIENGRWSGDPAPLEPGTESALGFHPWSALSSAQPTLIVYSSSVPLLAEPIDPARPPLKTSLTSCLTFGVHLKLRVIESKTGSVPFDTRGGS